MSNIEGRDVMTTLRARSVVCLCANSPVIVPFNVEEDNERKTSHRAHDVLTRHLICADTLGHVLTRYDMC